MLALLASVSEAKAGIACNLVLQGLAEAAVLPSCHTHLITDGSKTFAYPPLASGWGEIGCGLGFIFLC